MTELDGELGDLSGKTLFAKSGQEALEILQREEVHVIVTDMRMPESIGDDSRRFIAGERFEHMTTP